MKKIIVLLNCMVIALIVNAQAPALQWAESMGGISYDDGKGIGTDASGNVYVSGDFKLTADFDPGAGVFNITSAGSYDVFISKLNVTGNFVWAKTVAGTDIERGIGSATDTMGNTYTLIYYKGTADFDPGPATDSITAAGSFDFAILKLDSAGNFIWAKNIGGINNDGPFAIVSDASGNVYVTGNLYNTCDFDPGPAVFNLTSAGIYDAFILKLDAAGNFKWAKQLGGTSDDEGHGIAVDAAGNVFTTGLFTGTADFDPGAGTFNLVATGPVQDDVFISKLDSSGNFVWAKQLGGSSGDEGYSITVDKSANVYTTGVYYGAGDYDPGPGTFTLTPMTSNGSIFVSKLDSAGNFKWAKQIGSTLLDQPSAIAADTSGNLYLTGDFSATTDFNPGPGTFNLNYAGGSYDIFILKLDSAGNFAWAQGIDGATTEYSYAMSIDPLENLYLTGGFDGTTDFDPGAGTTTLSATGLNDIFVMKMNQGFFTGANEVNTAENILAFPNPSNEQVNLSFDHALDCASLLLINTTGQIIMEKENLSGKQFTLDLSSLADGIYFVELRDGKNTSRIKVIKD